MRNCIIRNNVRTGCPGIWIEHANARLINCIFDNNDSTGEGEFDTSYNYYFIIKDSLLIENCIFSNSDNQNPYQFTVFAQGTNQFCMPRVDIINTLFGNNTAVDSITIDICNEMEIENNIINCTFTGNSSDFTTCWITGTKNIYNCIMEDDTEYEIWLEDLSQYNFYGSCKF